MIERVRDLTIPEISIMGRDSSLVIEKEDMTPRLRQNPSSKPEGFFQKKSQNESDFFRVVIIDNEHNTYQEVIDICMKALGITIQEAFQIALAVDNNGFAEVFEAPYEEALRVGKIIEQIGIEVQIRSVT